MVKLLLFFALCASLGSFAQKERADSVLRLMVNPKEDTLTAWRYGFIATKYTFDNDSLALVYGEKALALSRRLRWRRGEIMAHYGLSHLSEKTRALFHALESVKIAEQEEDTTALTSSIFTTHLIFVSVEDYSRSLDFIRRLLNLSIARNDSIWIWNAMYASVTDHSAMGNYDSALFYAQQAYRMSLTITQLNQRHIDEDILFTRQSIVGWSLQALGIAESSMRNYEMALNYYLKALENAKASGRSEFYESCIARVSSAYYGLSKYDSAIYYARLYFNSVNQNVVGDYHLYAYYQMASTFHGVNNDSAVKYYKLMIDLQQTAFSREKRAEILKLAQEEDARQEKIKQEQKVAKDQRKRNLQFTLIGIGLISFIVAFLLLSQSFIVKSGFIKFLGVVALLLVFEFINLFVHPFIGEITHHSPILMLLIMVCIAALIVPAHHKLEKFLIHHLLEKNKKVRLANARKTIQDLGG